MRYKNRPEAFEPEPEQLPIQPIQVRNIVMSLPAAIGIIIATLTFFGSGTIAGVLFASRVANSLENLKETVASQGKASVESFKDTTASIAAQSVRITALELWQRQVDSVGSQPAKDVKHDLDKLREEFEARRPSAQKP
jgi:hypothetical protein